MDGLRMAATRFLRGRYERGVLARLSDYRCAICGCDLPNDWHADHKTAFSKGGETVIENMQALCPACNLKKGDSVMELRAWQRRAVDLCLAGGPDFFLEATPGAGKSRAASFIADKRLKTDVSRLIVVVPTVALTEQWAEELNRHGIDAEYRKDKGNGWPTEFKAICVTYQTVAFDPARFRSLVSCVPTMVILDEVHHCGDEADWGKSMRHAFESAAYRLCLSGTPFRTKSDPIPFLRYIASPGHPGEQEADPDYRYGYDRALRDGVCRHVYFPAQGGRVEWSTHRGEFRSLTFDDELEEKESNQRLYTALWTGTWVKDTVADANRALEEMRQDDPDAGGLAICIDREHARHVAKIIQDQTGVEPVCVLSDDTDADSKIKAFAKSMQPWIVAVRMVSEGIDIPRLRVGVYATTCKTELFFRQAVGRFVRVQEGHDDHTASLFIPDDHRLRLFAEEIKQQRKHCLEEEIEQDERQRADRNEEMQSPASFFMPIDSTAEHKGTVIDGDFITPEELQFAADMAKGLPMSTELAVRFLRKLQHNGQKPMPAAATPKKSDERKRLREQNNKLAKQIAYHSGKPFKEVNIELNYMVGIRSVAQAKVVELESRLRVAKEWYGSLAQK